VLDRLRSANYLSELIAGSSQPSTNLRLNAAKTWMAATCAGMTSGDVIRSRREALLQRRIA
jgi:hypothetical protein